LQVCRSRSDASLSLVIPLVQLLENALPELQRVDEMRRGLLADLRVKVGCNPSR
jgi:hypothetical protein